MTGKFSATRADHGVLVAAVRAPNERITLVHRLRERLLAEGEELVLSSQNFAEEEPEDGSFWLEDYSLDEIPVWRYRAGVVSMERTCAMAYGENTVAVMYHVSNAMEIPCTLQVIPYLKFAPKETALQDQNSIFYYYQKLIQLQKNHSVFRDGDFTLLYPENADVFAYTRENREGKMLVVCNFTPWRKVFRLPDEFLGAQVLIANYPEADRVLRQYEAFILYQKKGE